MENLSELSRTVFHVPDSPNWEPMVDLTPSRSITASIATIAEDDVSYRYWQVESLLNQAADLLDRCAENLNRADDLWIKLAQYQLTLLEDIHADRSQKRMLDEGAIEAAANEAKIQRDEINGSVANSYWPGALSDIGAFTRQDILRNSVSLAFALTQGTTTNPTGYQAGLARNEHMVALMESELQRKTRDRSIIELDKEVERQKSKLHDESSLRQSRADLGNKGQSHDFQSKIEELVKFQIIPDFADAMHRCRTALIGLQIIYGWKSDEDYPPFPNIDADNFHLVVQLRAWVRSAIRWLLKFSHLDQGFAATYSLRRLVGEERWSAGTENEFRFHLPFQDFGNYRAVRLRGIVAFASSDDESAIWEVRLKAPKSALVIDADRTTADARTIDQSAVPRCVLGRVEGRHSPRAPDVAGLVSLFNVSPISANTDDNGAWVCRVERKACYDESSVTLKDVHIELCLLARPLMPEA